MISFLRGIVHTLSIEYAVIDVNGVGYLVYLTRGAFSKLSLGADVSLVTEMIVREDSMTIYGFKDEDEREFFRLLFNVTGIGPKTALAILSEFSAESLILAISTFDVKTLTKAPGIGRKTAERIALELRDKVAKYSKHADDEEYLSVPSVSDTSNKAYDAVLALMSLGYTQSESEYIVRKVKGDLEDPAAIVRAALADISQNR